MQWVKEVGYLRNPSVPNIHRPLLEYISVGQFKITNSLVDLVHLILELTMFPLDQPSISIIS